MSEYINCDNKEESFESLFKRLIEVDINGDLYLRTECVGGGGDCCPDELGNEGDVLTIVEGTPTWYAPEGGSCSITNITHDDLVAAMGAATLNEGCWYRITDFATVHYLMDYDPDTGAVAPATGLEDAPAPGNITIVPDAVGNNPITIYYIMAYAVTIGTMVRSLISIEIPVIIGDDTNNITINCDPIPDWAQGLVIYKGSISGIYDRNNIIMSLPYVGNYNLFGITPGYEYETVIEIPIYQQSDGVDAINTGATEPLIVLATSTSTINSRAYSEAFPQDIIHYEPLLSAEMQPYFADLYQETFVPGFKGYITYRKDTILNLETYYDWRAYQFRRWALNPDEWDIGTTYNAGDFVQYNSVVYKTPVESTGEEPGVTGSWITLYDLTAFPFYSWSSISCNGITADPAVYDDLPTFGTGCYNIQIGRNLSTTYPILGNSIVYLDACYDCKHGGDNFLMTHGSACRYMTYGNGCSSMTYASACRYMTYGSGCAGMTYGIGCSSMTYGSGCGTIIHPASSIKNRFEDGVAGIDLTGDAHVTGAYTAVYSICNDSTIVVSYIDCSITPTLTIELAGAQP
jgi:hypothetical protein